MPILIEVAILHRFADLKSSPMIEKIKDFLKKIGVFKYYMFLKNKLYLEKKLQVLERQQEEMRRKFYSSLINPGDLVFDVGANVGNRTSIFLELGAKVVAVEPQPACAALLREKFGNRINLEQVGLDEKNDVLTMYIADESTISTFSREYIDLVKETKFKKNKWEQSIQVPVIRIDELVGKYGVPVFCKIDVEGYELQVLKGLSRPIPMISFEYSVPELTDKLLACINYLQELDPRYRFNYSVQESMVFNLENWVKAEEIRNLVNTPAFSGSEFGDIYAKIID